MPYVDDAKIDDVAFKLYRDVYEAGFRGKERGRFALSREQMRLALDVERLHASTVEKLQEAALGLGLIIIDLDDIFPCIETSVVRQYRRPPRTVFTKIFGEDKRTAITTDDDE